MNVAPSEITDFLQNQLGVPIAGLEPLAGGAWSTGFGFTADHEPRVVRFGAHGDDYAKDRFACRWNRPSLPVPAVLAVGTTPWGDHFAVSRRAFGTALEEVDRTHGDALLPATVALLESLRDADLTGTTGWGGWDGNGAAAQSSWRERLLSVADGHPASRTHGWKAALAADPEGDTAFVCALRRLERIARDDVPRGLVHGDLLHRNVLVGDREVVAVFDWGCSTYGDPLYDLAWFLFWEPWHPGLRTAPLVEALTPGTDDAAQRVEACLLHIGLDHLAYNAFTGDQAHLRATLNRMREVTEDFPSRLPNR